MEQDKDFTRRAFARASKLDPETRSHIELVGAEIDRLTVALRDNKLPVDVIVHRLKVEAQELASICGQNLAPEETSKVA